MVLEKSKGTGEVGASSLNTKTLKKIGKTIKELVIQEANKIPKGKVTNFGHIALSLKENYGVFVTAQMVGWTLTGMKESEWRLCPWQRVVAKDGYISSLKLGVKGMIQKDLLIEEGVEVADDTVDIEKYGWFGLVEYVVKSGEGKSKGLTLKNKI